MALAGWEFSVVPADVDETPAPGEDPAAYVRRLAAAKARASAAWITAQGLSSADAPAIILAADTAVVDPVSPAGGGLAILGKPAGPEEAVQMLRRLRGRVHQVFTAAAGLRLDGAAAGWTVLTDVCIANVPMRPYSDEEIRRYVDSGDPLDKAGAYAIQHAGFHPVENFTGCTTAVMGLSLCHTAHLLEQLGGPPGNEKARQCLHTKACIVDF
jgi:MAF protein